jgi:hypothetical protein
VAVLYRWWPARAGRHQEKCSKETQHSATCSQRKLH